MLWAVPAATPVITPVEELTVAIPVALDVQVPPVVVEEKLLLIHTYA
jgi:hypothetical protein